MSVTTVNCQEKSKRKFPSIPLFLQKEKDSSRFRNEHGLEVWKRSAGGRPGIEKSLSSCAARVASTYIYAYGCLNEWTIFGWGCSPLGIHTVMVAFEGPLFLEERIERIDIWKILAQREEKGTERWMEGKFRRATRIREYFNNLESRVASGEREEQPDVYDKNDWWFAALCTILLSQRGIIRAKEYFSSSEEIVFSNESLSLFLSLFLLPSIYYS